MARTKKENGSSNASTATRGFTADFGPENADPVALEKRLWFIRNFPSA